MYVFTRKDNNITNSKLRASPQNLTMYKIYSLVECNVLVVVLTDSPVADVSMVLKLTVTGTAASRDRLTHTSTVLPSSGTVRSGVSTVTTV